MTQDKEKYIQTIKKLRLLAARTPYPGERDTALAKAEKFMLEHEISEYEVNGDELESQFQRDCDDAVNEYTNHATSHQNSQSSRQYNNHSEFVNVKTYYEDIQKPFHDPFSKNVRTSGAATFYKKHNVYRPKEPVFSGYNGHSVISDIYLREAINRSLRRDSNTDISKEDLKKIKKLRAKGMSIRDLSGLEFAVNLTKLDLSYNPITELEQLSTLRKLIYLNIEGIEASDFEPIMYLKKLKRLNVANTPVTDIGALFRLPLLKHLDLKGCEFLKSVVAPYNILHITKPEKKKFRTFFNDAAEAIFCM